MRLVTEGEQIPRRAATAVLVETEKCWRDGGLCDVAWCCDTCPATKAARIGVNRLVMIGRA